MGLLPPNRITWFEQRSPPFYSIIKRKYCAALFVLRWNFRCSNVFQCTNQTTIFTAPSFVPIIFLRTRRLTYHTKYSQRRLLRILLWKLSKNLHIFSHIHLHTTSSQLNTKNSLEARLRTSRLMIITSLHIKQPLSAFNTQRSMNRHLVNSWISPQSEKYTGNTRLTRSLCVVYDKKYIEFISLHPLKPFFLRY